MIWLKMCPVCECAFFHLWGERAIIRSKAFCSAEQAEDQFLATRLGVDKIVRKMSRCTRCGHIFQNPTYSPRELQLLYSNSGPAPSSFYNAAGIAAEKIWGSDYAKAKIKWRQQHYANLILHAGASCVVDYGGGQGINLCHPSITHLQRFVYDFGKKADYYLPGVMPLDSLESGRRFDFILHTHVLEHEPYPTDALESLRRIVSSNGMLYCETPFEYTERILTRRPGAIWHVNAFSRKTFAIAAQRAGWNCINIALRVMPYSHNRILCIVAKLQPASGKRLQRRILLPPTLFDMLRAFVFRIINAFANKAAPLFRRDSMR